ncbi:MAG: hypothetical protein GF331_10580 [Chitinivibrionales bacterium]|nr:hypothetical protein [Chitinivibrionales bacterium]
MPRGDGTGPMGMGPMSGRAAGCCAGFNMPGYANPAPGAGFGHGRGRRNWYRAGHGFGWQRAAAGYPAFGAGWAPGPGWQPRMSPEQEIDMLTNQTQHLEAVLGGMKKRLCELQNEDES